MKTKTIETITRHLKGIVAALDKEKDDLPDTVINTVRGLEPVKYHKGNVKRGKII